MHFTAKPIAVSLAIAVLGLAAADADAACSYPRAPDNIPNGETATQEEMLAAKKEVTRYNNDMTAYLSCIKLESDGQLAELEKQGAAMQGEEEKKAFAARKEEFEYKRTQKHNAAVDEVTAVVDRFNEQIRLFKKKKKKSG